MIKTSVNEDSDNLKPFEELSVSGRLVNAYNCLIMAEKRLTPIKIAVHI